MKKLFLVLLCLSLLSCADSEREPIEPEQPDRSEPQFVVTDANGVQYPTLDPFKIYCGPGWGTKFCRFLKKYDETIWADSENYYSDFSDIKISNFWGTPYFVSFFDIDSTVSYCKGWKLGETINDGIKWNVKIKLDREDALWFDYDYYGSGESIEYTITYKYEVIDGLLHFSSTDGQIFIFHPSERSYSKDAVATSEIIELEGCMFY